VRVYVESNFILELALSQEQADACDQILGRAESRSIELVVPAFSLAEPYHTLGGRHIQRQELAERLGRELLQLSRSAPLVEQTNAHRPAVDFLTRVGEEEAVRHRSTLERLIQSARLLPLDRATVERSWVLAARHDLRGPDAIVLASVLQDLEGTDGDEKLFLNRNVKDFDDPDIVELLAARACSLLPSFTSGVGRLEASLRGA
jgi:predicted nucleic acid-binding protein